MAAFCRKDTMARTLRECGVESFVPRAWVLPADAALLEEHLKKRAKGLKENAKQDAPEPFLIVKPVNT